MVPMMTETGQVRTDELPSTLQRSDAKAQRTFAEAHDAALKEYGDEQSAFRVAYSALEHHYEEMGDHWDPVRPTRR